MSAAAVETFKGLPVLKKTTMDKLQLPLEVVIHENMEEYSGWGFIEHVQWVSELTGIDLPTLFFVFNHCWGLITDESCSEVWLLSRNYWKTTARLIYQEEI